MSNETYAPIYQSSYLNANGCVISNDATSPNTVLDISAGMVRDSTNTYDMVIGNFLGINPGLTPNTVSFINSAIVGPGGIDVGTVAASTVYNIYVILDLTTYISACIMSTASPSVGPTMPYNYGAYRLIGHATTNSSAHFLLGYWSGVNTTRLFMYDQVQATAISAGNATVATAISLVTLVPSVQNRPIWIYSGYVPATAGNYLRLLTYGSGNTDIQITGQVATVQVTSNSLIMARLNVAAPSIQYQVASSSDSCSIFVAGYQFDL